MKMEMEEEKVVRERKAKKERKEEKRRERRRSKICDKTFDRDTFRPSDILFLYTFIDFTCMKCNLF